MNYKYYKITNELSNLKGQVASSFENSKLYQKEIINFNGCLSNFLFQYNTIKNDINAINNKCDKNNFKKTFSSLSYVTTRINTLENIINDIIDKVANGSEITYQDLLSDFNKTYEKAINQADALKNKIDNYLRCNNELRSMEINNPDYDTILNQKNSYLNTINKLEKNINIYITKLQELLDKGLIKDV